MTTTHTAGDITYDVHGDLADATPESPVLMMFGSPMSAEGFGTLRSHFTDRVVVTVDPRGSGRNPTDTTKVTPTDHAEDLHRVATALGAGWVDAFGSSGGAVNLLRWAELHPEDLRVVVAHEPPTVVDLPDRETVLAVVDDMLAAYDASGSGAAMARFIPLVMHPDELTPAYLERPPADPAMFGLPTEDDGRRDDPLMRNAPACNLYDPDDAALAAYGDRLVVAYGVETGEGLPARGARAVAASVGVEPVEFPSHHGGFLGGEFGQQGAPEEFAARLREVLAERA